MTRNRDNYREKLLPPILH